MKSTDIKACWIKYKTEHPFIPDYGGYDIRHYTDKLYARFTYFDNGFKVEEYVDNAGGFWYVDRGTYLLEDYGKTWALTEEELEDA